MAHNLSSFINGNIEPILIAWEKHAMELMGVVSVKDARDHAKGMLLAIVADMREGQSPEEQSEKSKGHGPQEEAGGQAELHGALRQKAGFSIPDIASEFRALRATVLRLWKESSDTATQSDIDGIVRFNEAVDKLLAESIVRYATDKDNELLEATQLSDIIIESAPDGFFMIDAELRLVRWNHYFREETGLSDEELKGKSILPFVMEEDRPMAEAKFLSAFAMGSTNIEVHWPTNHGLRLYHKAARRFKNKETYYLSCFGMDVTERKRVEKALTKEKKFFDAMVESAPGAFYVIDAQGEYCRWNKQLNRMTGLSDGELQCRPWLLGIAEEDRARAAEVLKEATANGYAQAELQMLTPGRNSRHFFISVRRFVVDDVTYLVGAGADTTDRRAKMEVLQHQAQIDPLTQVANRGRFVEIANEELARSRRYGHPLSLWMLDIDHFKAVNDTYGHHAGDVALQSLMVTSREALRDWDTMGRMGGEEFAVLLPETDTAQAHYVAERLRMAVAATDIPIEDGKVVHLTVSTGIATANDDDISVDTLLDRADKALYEAKRNGRNKVCVADEVLTQVYETA